MLALSLADTRDYVIIIFAGTGVFTFLIIALVTFLFFKKIGGAVDAVRGNLESTRTALSNAAATSSLITDAITKPVIKTTSFVAGAWQGLKFLGKLAGKRGGD